MPPEYGQPYGGGGGYGVYGEPELELDVNGPQPQERWTILLRLLLAIPHFVVLWLLDIAAFFVVIAGWFAALFTGRLPLGIRDFLSGVLKYQARVYGYVGMLTDEYPPFVFFEAPGYPVQLEIPPPTRLNPAAVLFRIILVIPWAIISTLVYYGWLALAFFFWVIALIAGQLPDAVFRATAAALRYGLRFSGYFQMLTPTIPKRLFGDQTMPPVAQRSTTRPLTVQGGAQVLLIAMVVLGAFGYIFGPSFSFSVNMNSDSNSAPAHSVVSTK